MVEKAAREKEELIKGWLESGQISDPRLIEAFRTVSRERFVPREVMEHAYGDYPLPIHAGQTISQPTTIMLMLQALELQEDSAILEIGAGSGYNAALMATVAARGIVISLEIVPELVRFARQNLRKAGIKNVKVVHADGSLGWEADAPYDRIICTAAVPEIAEAWIRQLKLGGIIVAPVGPALSQEMIKLRKERDIIKTTTLGEFVFVPLKGAAGYR